MPGRGRPSLVADTAWVRPAAQEALAEHRDWLSARLADEAAGYADPRIGPEKFARKLSFTPPREC